MKKCCLILLMVMILFIASCSGMEASYGGNPNLDGVTFDYLSSFVYKGSEYQVSFPVNVENAEFYIYEETEYKTEVENWTINYYYDAKYLYDQYFNEEDEVINALYENLLDNLDIIEEKLGYKVEIYPLNENEEIEVTMENIFDNEITCVIIDKYIPLRLRNSLKNYSYTISIPVKRYHVVKNENNVQNPFTNTIISWEDFLAIPNMNENIY